MPFQFWLIIHGLADKRLDYTSRGNPFPGPNLFGRTVFVGHVLQSVCLRGCTHTNTPLFGNIQAKHSSVELLNPKENEIKFAPKFD